MPSSNPLPSHEANLFKKILKCYEQKQYRKALQHVKEILKKFPDHGETLAMKGLILNYTNKKAEAFECAQRGLKNDLKSHVCWHVYGLLQRSDRKYDEAIKCYRNALKIDPGNLQILRDLSLLQIQIRDLEGFRDTRYQLLQLRPTQRVSWIGYAMSYHLLKDYSIANNILEEFNRTQPKTIDFEMSELLLYQNKIYQEAQLFEKSIKHLDENKNCILDKLALLEKKAFALKKINKNAESATIYEELIERNPDNLLYFQNLESCLNLENTDEKLDFYSKLSEKYPRSNIPRKMPLLFLSNSKQFSFYMDEYLKRSFRKGITPLFKEVKCLYSDQFKCKTIESLIIDYAANLEKNNSFLNESSHEPPSCLLWVYYFIAQHFDYLKQFDKALEFINKAIDHTPTLVELYILKGKIYKHSGKLYDAVKCLDEAQSLDTADRFVNYKCSKYMLRANMIKEAEEIAAKFTRETSHPSEYLKEMQCMWYEIEAASAYKRIGKFGDALKKCHQVERHFQEFIEDQFDFHSYCMRKMTLSAYVDMLRLEDRIKSHPFFFKASIIAIQIYLRLHDSPLEEIGAETATNTENLSPAELKKLKNKLKKQQLKAQNEKEKQQQLEQKKKEMNKQKNKEDSDLEQPIEEELLPEKLERPENPLEECNRFLKPIEEFAFEYKETHFLAFEVYYRKNKPLLLIKTLKKIKKFSHTDASLAKFHYYSCKFLLKYETEKDSYNKLVLECIEDELKNLELYGASVERLNEEFLKTNQSNFECLLEASKILYDLNPANNQNKALSILKNISKEKVTVNFKTAIDALRIISETCYFGKCSIQEIENVRNKLKEFFPEATFFKTPEEQANELVHCIQTLSINLFLSSAKADIVDKMSSVNIK